MKFKTHDKELKFMIRLVRDAYKIIKTTKPIAYTKGKDDLVTSVDLAVEKYIIDAIKSQYPTFSIISEEYNPKATLTDNCFIIDPIDGTINFANGLPLWSIEIACRMDGDVVASVIYTPLLNALYYAVKGEGAYLNGKRIHVSDKPIKDLPYSFGYSKSTKENMAMFNAITSKNIHLRSFKSTSYAISNVASGSLGAHVLLKYTPWDIEPGVLICKEAGGVAYCEPKCSIVACNDEMLKFIKNSYIKTHKENKNG